MGTPLNWRSAAGLVVGAFLALATASSCPVGAEEIAVVGGVVHSAAGDPIADGVVILVDGRVTAVGPRANTPIPPGCRVIDVPSGGHVAPGLIDLDSALLYADDNGARGSAGVVGTAVDDIEVFGARSERLLREGITSVALPARAAGSAVGLGAVYKLSLPGDPASPRGGARLLAREVFLGAQLGGSGVRSTGAERLEQYYRLRQLLLGAREYKKAWERHWKAVEAYNKEVAQYDEAMQKTAPPPPAEKPAGGGEATPGKPGSKEGPRPPGAEDPPKPGDTPPAPAPAPAPQAAPAAPAPPKRPTPPTPPGLDSGQEALLLSMEGKLPWIIEAQRVEDLEYALRLKEEFSLQLRILGGAEAPSLAERLAKAAAPVIVAPTWLDLWGLGYRAHSEGSPGDLVRAGVRTGIAGLGRAPTSSAALRLYARFAVRGGMPVEDALSAVTRVPAEVLGLEGRIGSIAPGRDADLVIYDRHPLDLESRVLRVLLDGVAWEPPARTPPTSTRESSAPGAPSAPMVRLAARRSADPPSLLDGRGSDDSPKGATGPALAITGARIVRPTADGVRILERGTLLALGGRIEAVGEDGSVPLPADTVTESADGQWLFPGWIDAHSYAGSAGETDEIASAINEDLRVLDAFDPWDAEVRFHIERGVTSALLSPGSVNVVAGLASLTRLLPAEPRLRVVCERAAVKASLQVPLSLPRRPTSLSGAVQLLDEWVRGGGPRRTVGGGPVILDPPSRAAAERFAGLLEETGAPGILLEGGLDPAAWSALEARLPVVLGPYALEEEPRRLRVPALLASRGAPIAFGSHGTRRDVLLSAALAVREGLRWEVAVQALTAFPARMLGLDEEVGVLEPGAAADLSLWSGDPLRLEGRLERVFIDGVEVFRQGAGEAGTAPTPPAAAPPPASSAEPRKEGGAVHAP